MKTTGTGKTASEKTPQAQRTAAAGDGAIHVTQAVLPPAEVYHAYLEEIFTSRQLTNEGKFAKLLEVKLASLLGVPNVSLCCNGTLALQLAIRLMGLQGKEVITTPFTYVATASALLWEGCTPVFADIDEESLCLSPDAAAALVTDNTAAVLPVHIFGNACDTDALDDLAASRGIVSLYDASQAVGCVYKGKALPAYGDLATCSFHATKVFHTVEGGGVVSHTEDARQRLALLRACGHRGDTHYGLGINAKMSELHAVMGLSLLPELPKNIEARKQVWQMYDARLPEGLRRPRLREGLEYNYSYFPVIFESASLMERALARMNRERIFPRRYFFPSLNTISYMPRQHSCPVAEDISSRILCLPLYAQMDESTVARITRLLR